MATQRDEIPGHGLDTYVSSSDEAAETGFTREAQAGESFVERSAPSSSFSIESSETSRRRLVRKEKRRRDTYDADFATVDWVADMERSKLSQRDVVTRLDAHNTLWRQALSLLDALQSWIALALIGICTGLVAAMIDTGAEWMTDIKFGFCKSGFWLSRSLCCRASLDVSNCADFLSWGEALGAGQASLLASNYVFYFIIAVFSAGLAAVMCKLFAPYAAGSGIPEIKTILGGIVIRRFLSGWTLAVKSLGLVLSVGSGLNLGKEGPFVHVSACIASLVSGLFEKYRANEGRKRELLSAAAAAGVSVAFGAPVGGVLFSLEEVSSYFPHRVMWRSFFCAIVASITLQRLNPLDTGKLVMFEVTYHQSWKWFEVFPFLMLGCIGGLVGALFIRLNVRWCRFRRDSKLKEYPVWEVLFVAAVTALINFWVVLLSGSSTELLAALFSECRSSDDKVYNLLCREDNASGILLGLFLAGCIKFILAVFTFGMRIPAGLFIPSLSVGACIGRLVGLAMRLLQSYYGDTGIFAACSSTTQCITPGVYAIVGAAAVLGGVTRMTVSLVVIIFELTGGLEYVLPTMLAAIMAKWIGDAFSPDGIYDEHIRINGYPYLDNKAEFSFDESAGDVMTTGELDVLPVHGHTVRSLDEFLGKSAHSGFPVLTSESEGLLVGYISRDVLRSALDRARGNPQVDDNTRCYFAMDLSFPKAKVFVDLSRWLDRAPVQIVTSTPLNRVCGMFLRMGLRYLLVTRHGRLVGIIKKKDILEYIQVREELRRVGRHSDDM